MRSRSDEIAKHYQRTLEERALSKRPVRMVEITS